MLARLWCIIAALIGVSFSGGAVEARRLALVIGQNGYPGSSSATVGLPPLFNSINDARGVSSLLTKHGFELISCGGPEPGCTDADRAALLQGLAELRQRAEGADLALVYFAGHGMATDEGNVLTPTDARLDCATGAVINGVTVERVMQAVEPARHKVLILDACRDNPVGKVCPGLADKKLSFNRIEAGAMRGFLLVTSTQFGQEALDGPPGTNSPFATALLKSFEASPNVYFEQVFNTIARATYDAALKQNGFVQIPGKVVGGEAPADCLAGRACVGDVRMAALERDLEQTLMQETFQRAISERAVADIGQRKALEAIVRHKSSLDERDISGINFAQAQVPGIRARKAAARLANFDEATLLNGELADVSFAFATMRRVDLTSANLERASFGFTELGEARLGGVKAAGSAWYAAVAPGADFTGADLKGASFIMADLRGANFTNAELTDATFHGALLDGARFDGAIIRNTGFGDVTLAQPTFSTDQLRGLCQNLTQSFNSSKIMLVENNKELMSLDVPFLSRRVFGIDMEPRLSAKQLMPYCANREHVARGETRHTPPGQEDITVRFVLPLDRDLLDKGLHRERLLSAARKILTDYAKTAGKSGVFDHVNVDRAKALAEFSRRASQNTKPAGDVWFSGDTMTLLNIRHNPRIAESLDWAKLARHYFGGESTPRRGNPGSTWPRFFSPEVRVAEEISDEMIRMFKDWTIARSRAVPDSLVWREDTGLGDFPGSDLSIYDPGAKLAASMSLGFGHVTNLPYQLPTGARPYHKLFVAMPLSMREYSIKRDSTFPPSWTDVKFEIVDILHNDPEPVSNAREKPFSGFFILAVPLKAEFTIKGALSRTVQFSERITGDALGRLVSGTSAELSDPLRRSGVTMRFGTDQVVRTSALDKSSSGTWRTVDDRLCISVGAEPTLCYAIYKDVKGYALVSRRRSADDPPSILRTASFAAESVGGAGGPQTNSAFAIAGVRLGMGMAEARQIALEHAGSGASSVDPIRKRERAAVELFDTGFIVRSDTKVEPPSDIIVTLSYPFKPAQTVDAIVRLLRIPSTANIQEDIVKQLIAQYGPTSGEYRGRDSGSIDLFWTVGGVSHDKRSRDKNHECHPGHVGYQSSVYIGRASTIDPASAFSIAAPELYSRDWGVPVTCKTTLMSRVSAFNGKGHQVFSWLIEPGEVGAALKATENSASSKQTPGVPKVRF